ncbi:MAG TPA: glycine oxidase ThiO [Longimicrobiales bacterium]|nr:glycine oxidase ThiO [Longimicrobiales bacterium]
MPRNCDLVVVGAGAIGSAIAWRAAQRGLSVTLIERAQPGRAATWAAAGMLSPLGETRRHPHFLQLAQASLEHYPAFLGELHEATGTRIEYGTPGKLEVALNETQLASLHAGFAGTSAELLSSTAAQALEPALAPTVQGAALLRADAYVDNRILGETLALAAARSGVRVLTGTIAARIESSGSSARPHVSGVSLGSGERIACPTVVLACGAWSAKLAGIPRELPVFPVRGQMVALRTDQPLFQRMLHSARCYLIARASGRVLVGATVEYAGFDPRTTTRGIEELLAGAQELVPALSEAQVVELWTGFRPGTPDELPILGPEPELPGLVYATGHFRNGILLAPITASLIAAIAAGDQPEFPLSTFSAERFVDERSNPATTSR